MNRILLIVVFVCMGSMMDAQVLTEGDYNDSIIFTAACDTDSVAAIRWEDLLRSRLDSIVREVEYKDYYTGICVYDLEDTVLLYGYNQQKRMRPASNEKVLTAVTALDILGADHLYTTKVYTTGGIVADSLGHRVLEGNVYVVGDFDPKLERADVSRMAEAIKATGIDSISGSILADISMKDTLYLGNGWCWDDSQPFLIPLSLGGSSYTCENYRINRYNPSLDFVQLLKDDLTANGIGVSGSAGIGEYVPDEFTSRIMMVTHSVSDILGRMMKNSDNLYAESMFYQLAADQKKGIGWKDCAAEVEAMVRRAAGTTEGVDVADGSGLSLYNYVTPAVLTAVLRYAYYNKNIFSALYPALPIAGVDGTISGRMSESKAYANVHAKTGTVTGVSTLAGYVRASNGHMLAFAIMNNGVESSSIGRAVQDKVCAVLAE